METNPQFSFTDFPEDVQLCILSFLTPPELATFACTSKRYVTLCRDDPRLWFSMCDRRWGSHTHIKKWARTNDPKNQNNSFSYKHLYHTLLDYEHLIGFWRRSGTTTTATATTLTSTNTIATTPPPLVFFEWGPFYITGSRISPSSKPTSYKIEKTPFLWISLTSDGQPINYYDLEGKFELKEDLVNELDTKVVENEFNLIPVNVSFMGKCHVAVEENLGFFRRVSSSGNVSVKGEELDDMGVSGSPPDRLMSEIYQFFANRTSPGGNGASRRQRRREKEKLGRRKLEPEHFVKIVNCSPMPGRPLQGLWKGLGDNMSLNFYLVAYDDIGGITCRKIGDSSGGYSPVFWATNTRFLEFPLSPEEENIYDSRIHLQPHDGGNHNAELPPCSGYEVSHMLHINSSYDLVIPELHGITTVNPPQMEGRLWQYWDGTFGFGFLRDNFIIDLKHIAQNGHLLDTKKPCSS